ncbi:MAG: methionine gamma-lyase family protein [Candidatus Improbicoccus devescovinae]|nr:MAG: methionine gamma-lyase family protein [Candidatus Improbicoccus devescovinae]
MIHHMFLQIKFKYMLKVNSKISYLAEQAIEKCQDFFVKIEQIYVQNSKKVLSSFLKHKINENHFVQTTGYGYSNFGKHALNSVCADIFNSESAFVSENFASGTHALSISLLGISRPGFNILSITGAPYDTLLDVIYKKNVGSLHDYNINFESVNYVKLSQEEFCNLFKNRRDIVFIQRSKGYDFSKECLSPELIGKLSQKIKQMSPETVVIVDNCYGEFTQPEEPTAHGADLIIGSLIKNPGGGIAPSGGYIAGKKKLVELCADRFIAPGLGFDIGNSHYNRELFMGFFYAPRAVCEALKTAIFSACFFELLGYNTDPSFSAPRFDIVQTIKFDDCAKLINFCKKIQEFSPIGSNLHLEPWDMPGYSDKIIMASGGFISGSSIELSVDAPIRPPYVAYLQGGTDFEISKLIIMNAASILL